MLGIERLVMVRMPPAYEIWAEVRIPQATVEDDGEGPPEGEDEEVDRTYRYSPTGLALTTRLGPLQSCTGGVGRARQCSITSEH